MSPLEVRHQSCTTKYGKQIEFFALHRCAVLIMVVDENAKAINKILVNMVERTDMSITFITVFGPVTSSNRIAYPTLSPSSVSISSLTLLATLMAATRLGCVQPTTPFVV